MKRNEKMNEKKPVLYGNVSGQCKSIYVTCQKRENQGNREGFPGGTSGKEPACQCRRFKRCGFDPWVRKIPQRRTWQPTPVFTPGESHGQRNLEGYNPQGHKELDMSEVTQHALTQGYREQDSHQGQMVQGRGWNGTTVGQLVGLGRDRSVSYLQ